MTKTDIRCSKCGSADYQLLDAKTGEATCRFCRNKWIEPGLKRMSETEKFLEEQARQPRVTYDNTTETDAKLMEMIGGLAGARGVSSARGFFKNPLRGALIVTGIIVFLIVVCLIVSIVGGLRSIFG